ncbi:MAG: LamG-like jellyroll fold domain-containing protein [Chitinophagaceae bacterium]
MKTKSNLFPAAFIRFFTVLIFLVTTSLAHATGFTVTNGNNAGAGSLRQAILDANADAAAPHTITFTYAGVINITASLPTITRQVTIDGGSTITLSAPGGDNAVAIIVLGAGADNSIIRNMAIRNTGLEGVLLTVALTGITVDNVTVSQTAANYLNYGLRAAGAVTNLTVKNFVVTQLQDKLYGIRIMGAATNVMIDGYNISAGSGQSGAGVFFDAAVNGLTVKNSTIDMDDPATTDDGDYGIYFKAAVNNLTVDNCIFKSNEIASLYFYSGALTNVSVINSKFYNTAGYTQHSDILTSVNTTISNFTANNNIFDADQLNTTDDADYGIYFNSSSVQSATITNNTFNEYDADAIFFYGTVYNFDNILIKGNTFTKNGNGSNGQGGIYIFARNNTSDGGPVLITENTFSESNGNAILIHSGSTTSYVLPNFTISKNIIYNTKTAYGVIRPQYVNNVVITQNSIYGNAGAGIELTTNGNCKYENTLAPVINSSAETAAGIYDVNITLPAACGSGNCSVEVFSTPAGTPGIGGQHYVVTKTGLSAGVQTMTGITGAFPEITAAPYGVWTITYKVNNTCGTSEFSNKKAIKVNGPAGVSNGISVWLRSDEITVNNADPTASGLTITGWDEFSGSGSPSASTIVNDPRTKLNGINFNPVADMDNDVIRGGLANSSTWLATPAFTSVAVFNPLSITAAGDRYYTLFSQAGQDYTTNAASLEFYKPAASTVQTYRGNALLNPAISGIVEDRPGVFTSATTATDHTLYYNGASKGTAAYNKGNLAVSQWFIGGGYTTGWTSASETDFAEVFTYNRTLTAIELQKVQSYMALKYAIPMKQNYVLSSGTQVWDVTANATYSKEIGALVKDNVSVLHQKQAKAFHTDEVLTVALGSAIAPANNNNTATITNDLSVFMWGNDSTATTYTQAFTAGTYSTLRMPRVWKVQKINWADQNIIMQVTGSKANNYLLISSDPTFATITQELPLTATGTITLSSSLFTNGIYFTFGRHQKAPGGVAPGLSVWVKADEGANLTGTNITTWEDQGPSQRIWTLSGTNATPWISSSINYNPAVQFATNYFTYPQFTQSFTAGEIFSTQSSGINNVVSFPWQLGGSSGATGVVYRYTDNNMYLHFGTNARRQFSYAPKDLSLPAILNVSSAANLWTASLDAKTYSTAAYATSFAQALTLNYIGAGHNSAFNGLLPEVIEYNRKLSATERQQVNTYLAIRYGITLDQTSAYDYLASDGTTTMWKASDNGVYKNNIAGIGRDDIGSLHQKQSRSINTAGSGNLIAVANGTTLAVSNDANTDSVDNNKSFLTWGDNAGAVTYTTPVTANNVTLRMPRVWKADKTNWASGNITIKLFAGVTNTYLLISNTDGTFATIDQELAMNTDSTITINSDLLPDGAFFTFGKQLKGPGYVNSGITLWLRADDNVSTVDHWGDYSGNDNDALQATAASQPVFTAPSVNFNPAFDFDGSADYMDIVSNAGISGTNQFTVVTVQMRNSVGGNDAMLSQQGIATNTFSSFFANTNQYAITATNTGAFVSTTTYPTANIPFLNATTRGAANLFSLYRNGAPDGTGTGAYNFLSLGLRVGNRGASGDMPFDGHINEEIVYNRTLTAPELQQVNSYLALKYGITLNSGGTDYIATDGTTKMWTVAKNGIYKNNIAGIGRDDKTDLYQKQSRSSNDTLITIAAGASVAATNQANASSLDEMSFFTWADNNLATTYTVPVSSTANATFRMPRVWKVDRTNWNDQDITVKVLPGGDRYLLVNTTDPTFGAGTLEFAITPATYSTTLNSSNIPDGAYFTIATKIVGPACVNAGIVAWLRSDYAAAADSWVDFSGNQINATQTTVANQPLAVDGGLNYNTALKFDGVADYLQIPQAAITGKFPAGNAARTIIGVGNPLSAIAYQTVFTYGTATANQASGLLSLAQVGVFEASGPANNIIGTANSFLANKSTIISGRYVGGGNTLASLYVNSLTANASGNRNWATTLSAQGSQIGKYVGSTNYWNGNIGEVIVYNRNLTDPEFQRVSSYLGLKYGITLDQTIATDYIASNGTTMMWKASDNTGYNKRITGIGRDDCTNLYQKQSLSVDTGIVAMAIGDAVQTSNTANTNSIANNDSYFVFADNGLSAQYNVNISGSTDFTARMSRIWKVDKTNWADAAVTFKLTGGSDKIYMLVSTDAIFDATDAAYQLDAFGNTGITTDQIPDGAYFTFAKLLLGPGYVNTGVQLWLRADDNVSAADTWYDYSGNDNDATQATAANQPVLTAAVTNYNPGFVFDGTNDNMTLDITKMPAGTVARTLIGVGTPGIVTGTHYMMGWGTAATSQHTSLMNLGTTGFLGGYSDDVTSAGLAVANTPEEMFGTWAGTAGAANLYSKMKLLSGPTNKSWNTGATGAVIGSRVPAGTETWNGSLVEAVVYNRAVTTAERQRITSYLATKYGYTIDQTTPNDYVATDWNGATGTKYWDATANAAYKNNITGIGRDDKTAQYQRQSRSVNTANFGNMVAIGLTGIAATNQANTNTFTSDLSFLVWGDDAAVGTKQTEYPASLNASGCSKITRLQREWKVQKTGNVSDLQMQFFLAGQVPNSTGQSDLKLLIDDDNDFSNGGTTIIDAAAYDATTQTVTFSGVDFTSVQYFTLVIDLTNQGPGGVLTNLNMWYRADKAVTTGTGVSLWADQSASAKDVTQATTTSQPVYNSASNLINFNPNLSFDGTNDVLANAAVSHSAAASGEDIFAVVLPNAVAGTQNVVGLGTVANTNNTTESRYTANKVEYGAGAGFASITNAATSNGIVQIANANRTGAGAANLLLNGTSVVSGTLSVFNTFNQLNIGSRRFAAANSQFFNGQIAEVAIYNRQLSLTERQEVASYFAIKYGITLPHNYLDASANVLWSIATNTGYNNNITGIGRDDCSGLHQKESKSVNTAEALVTLGNQASIATSNATNTNSMNNNTALLTGDNNANRTVWTATGAPTNRQRIARTWRVQETNAVSTVTVQVPANSSALTVKLPLELDNIVYLLVSPTNNFVSDYTEVPMALNGTDWETTYDFNSGDYYTFATNDACVSSAPLLTAYGVDVAASANKCYVNGWIYFRDPVDNTKFIAAVYDPSGLIDRSLINATVDVNSAFAAIGKGNSVKASRLMRRMLQLDCASCYDAMSNPMPNFTVRMFYSPDEKSDAESVETNNMEAIKTANGITDPHLFKWFKASGKTVNDVVTGLTPSGISAGGQEWADGVLPVGQLNGVDYIDFVGINSFSTFGGIWNVNSNSVLPVTGLDVQAVPMNGIYIKVNWSTLTEINNAGFEVQRSVDGRTFNSIASAAGNGTTSSISRYSVNDNNVTPGVIYYYRIRQIDIDGRSMYSKIVTAQLKPGDMYVTVMPNPVNTTLQLQVITDRQQPVQVTFTDVLGQSLDSRKLYIPAGGSITPIDVSKYSNGTYFIRIMRENGAAITKKFIIQKNL